MIHRKWRYLRRSSVGISLESLIRGLQTSPDTTSFCKKPTNTASFKLVYLRSFNCKTARWIFMKFRMNVSPLQAIPKPHFFIWKYHWGDYEKWYLPGYSEVYNPVDFYRRFRGNASVYWANRASNEQNACRSSPLRMEATDFSKMSVNFIGLNGVACYRIVFLIENFNFL
jgi:hypothetical protein